MLFGECPSHATKFVLVCSFLIAPNRKSCCTFHPSHWLNYLVLIQFVRYILCPPFFPTHLLALHDSQCPSCNREGQQEAQQHNKLEFIVEKTFTTLRILLVCSHVLHLLSKVGNNVMHSVHQLWMETQQHLALPLEETDHKWTKWKWWQGTAL